MPLLQFTITHSSCIVNILTNPFDKLKLDKEIIKKQLDLGDIMIYDNNENKIADFYSDGMGIIFDSITSCVDLELPKLMLRGGDYYIAIAVQTTIRVVQQIDVMHHVLNFKVFPGDYWESGKVNRATNVALIDGLFKV